MSNQPVRSIREMGDFELVIPGSGACAGCPSTIALRIVGKALGSNAVMLMTPSCAVASIGMLPKTCYALPVQNICFAAAGASGGGASAAFDVLYRKGKIREKPIVFNWTGDGGTYDIGFQGISAAAERNDDYMQFCYNNEAYSNTGVQRSGATPRFAATTNTPLGKETGKKNMPLLMLDHQVPYVATASLAYPMDLYRKVAKAKSIPGFRYIEILAPCYPGWKFDASQTIEYSRLAVKSRAWLLWEAENGKVTFNSPTKQLLEGKVQPVPLEEYLAGQGRFKHILQNPDKDRLLKHMEADMEDGIRLMQQRTK